MSLGMSSFLTCEKCGTLENLDKYYLKREKRDAWLCGVCVLILYDDIQSSAKVIKE